jgi:hypothetical protein
MDEEPSETTTDAGIWGGVPIVMGALPLIVPVPTVIDALMVAVESFPAATAVNTDVATPAASVVADVGTNVPAVALITENETAMLGTRFPEVSRTVAVTVVLPRFAMVDDERRTVTFAGVLPLFPVVVVGGVVSSTPHPLGTTAKAHSAAARIWVSILFIRIPLPQIASPHRRLILM